MSKDMRDWTRANLGFAANVFKHIEHPNFEKHAKQIVLGLQWVASRTTPTRTSHVFTKTIRGGFTQMYSADLYSSPDQ